MNSSPYLTKLLVDAQIEELRRAAARSRRGRARDDDSRPPTTVRRTRTTVLPAFERPVGSLPPRR
jgi:hypothetical protein